MPNRRDVVESGLERLSAQERRVLRDLQRVYARARRRLLAEVLDGWPTGRDLTADEALRLLRNRGLLEQIERRLLELQQQTGNVLENAIREQPELASEEIERQLRILPKEIRDDIGAFTRIERSLVERYIAVATEQLDGQTAMTRTLIRRELQSGLIQGQDFVTLARSIFRATSPGEGPAVWRNGELSAMRLTRRVVIEANNASRQEFIRQASENAQGIQKQLVAAINGDTTQTCLRAHGQIQPVDEPYQLSGQPRFAREMQYPGFHWNCRSASVMYHPAYESGALNTATMRRQAQRQRQENAK